MADTVAGVAAGPAFFWTSSTVQFPPVPWATFRLPTE